MNPYSVLAEKYRKANIEDIEESAFPPPGKLPPIPDTKDDATMELPPDEAPAEKGLPEAAGRRLTK